MIDVSLDENADARPAPTSATRSAQNHENQRPTAGKGSRSYNRPVDPRPIGVFDSGVGGLTVLHECLVTMPHEDFVYLGDHARLPYGPRPLDEIRGFAREIGGYLEAQDVKLVLVACNAATSAALPRLQEELTVPVVGVITPEAHAAVQATRNRRIGLLATQATVEAGRYAALVRALDAGSELVPVACPRLVPLIESDDPFSAQTTEAVREYASPLKDAGVDTVILGCTHYPLIRPIFQRVFGRDVTLVFSAEETAREVAETLARKGIENEPGREGAYRFLTTGDPALFRELGERFLQLPLGDVEHVALADLEALRHEADGRRERAAPGLTGDRLPRAAARAPCSTRRARRTSCARPRSTRAFLAGCATQGRGWLTAEYSLLPASTGERTQREASAGKQKGRTVEIQRLIGRALRAVADFEALGERTLWLDCDVLQADGGTRCASISGAYVAAARALDRAGLARVLPDSVGAVSVGIVDGEQLLDLDYEEDSSAEVDLNVVITGDGRLVEVQATAERAPFARAELDKLLDLAASGIETIGAAQRQALDAAGG